MRIDAYNKISQLYNTSKINKMEKSKEASRSDQLEISQTGKAIQTAKNALKNTPDIRQDKVNDIKKRIETGTYKVTMEEVVDKLVDNYFDKTI